jgi:tetratricopeptide (TPR) repeat protein/tRNA A-37 threonylcarbamoyl transferase component Bud32
MAERPKDPDGDPLDRGLAVAFGPGPAPRGTLPTHADSIGPAHAPTDATGAGTPAPADPTRTADADRTATLSVGSATSDGQRFRILRPHAQGGLGAVFVALDEELHREVALKQILDHHADDPDSRTRFVLEAEITGGLEHPGIVPVYGLGSYGDGRPYYAMRFIRGDSLKEAITAFHADPARESDPGIRSLAWRKLLRRFVDVCNAINYAHTRGVIHRDIKPANVIVGEHGETLVVDWGLAKVRGETEPGHASDERTLVPSSARGSAKTLSGSALGTPAYMSPEQAAGDLDRLGPRSDVYSLGATLYCLLTDKPPFEGNDLGAVMRSVRKGDFPTPRTLDPTIDRALEAVCLKAMALEPEDRYATPKSLADDVERWAADEPVSAWREPLAARAGRWMRRHWTWVTGAAILLVTVTAATAVGLVLLGRKNREISAAVDQAEAVNNFLTEDLLGQADPDVNDRDKKVTVEELLHRAGTKMEGNAKFVGRPEVEATLRLTLGKTFFKLSNVAEAEKHLTRSAELRRKALGQDHPQTLAAQEALADLRLRGSARFAETEPLARSTWQARARVLGSEHPDTLDSLDTYAGALGGLGRVAEAIPLFRECLEARRRLLGAKHPDTLTSMNNLAHVLVNNGEWAQAIPLIRGVLDVYRERGPETENAASTTNLAAALYMNGDLEEADRMLRQAVDRATVRIGAEDLRTAALRGWQVRVWIDQGRWESAVTLGRDVLAVKRRVYPADHPSVGYSLADLGRGLVSLGRFAEAEPLLAESRAIFTKAPPPMKYFPAWAECWHGASMVGLRRYAEAEPLLLAAERKLRGSPLATRRHHREAEEQLIRLYENWDKPEQAAKWRGELAGTR